MSTFLFFTGSAGDGADVGLTLLLGTDGADSKLPKMSSPLSTLNSQNKYQMAFW